jgi:hypothetical protein
MQSRCCHNDDSELNIPPRLRTLEIIKDNNMFIVFSVTVLSVQHQIMSAQIRARSRQKKSHAHQSSRCQQEG